VIRGTHDAFDACARTRGGARDGACESDVLVLFGLNLGASARRRGGRDRDARVRHCAKCDMPTRVCAAYEALQASVGRARRAGAVLDADTRDVSWTCEDADDADDDDDDDVRRVSPLGLDDDAPRHMVSNARVSTSASRRGERRTDEALPTWRSPRFRVPARASACSSAYAAACASTGARVSSRVLQQLCKRKADVSSAGLGSIGAMAVAAGVAANVVTESLDVSRNRIDDDGIHALVHAATRAKALKALNFSENILSRAIEPQCAEALKRLKKLNVSACGIDDEAARTMFTILCDPQCALETLNVSKNKITNISGCAIGDALAMNDTLRVLDVSWNAVGAQACAEISRGLKANRALETLSLAWNGIGDEGGKHIGDSLGVNRSLRVLDLSRCRLGGDACMVISEGLRSNYALTTLRLDHNACGEDGGRHLMTMLMHNDYLTTLTLDGSSFVDVPRRKKHNAATATSTATTSTESRAGATFNLHNPDGAYALHLHDTRDRAIASQLWNLERDNPGSITNVKIIEESSGARRDRRDGPPATDALQVFIAEGIDAITATHPRATTLEVHFSLSATAPPRAPRAIEPEDLDNLARQLRVPRLSDFERLSRLTMFCASHYFLVEHARVLLETFTLGGSDRLHAAAVCHARLLDAEHAERMFASRAEYEALRAHVGAYARFRVANPTGRYELNLAVDIDRIIAATMIDSAMFEGLRRRTWRNVRVNRAKAKDATPSGVPGSVCARVPHCGTLEFDYTSSVRVDRHRACVEDRTLHDMLHDRGVLDAEAVEWRAASNAVDALHALRECSTRLGVSARQYARICNAFAVGADRVEACVILFTRVMDSENISRVIGAHLSCFEQSYFGSRVGWRNALGDQPFASFTMHYRLDLSCDEQASVARHLVTSAVREYRDVQVIRNVTINGRRLVRDPVEDDALWSVLTAESFTPILEFDYFGADVWDVVARELDVKDIPSDKSTREMTLKRLATRLAFTRAASLHVDWLDFVATMKKTVKNGTGGNGCGGGEEDSPSASNDASVVVPNHRRVWNDRMRTIIRAEISHASAEEPPLRAIFNLLDADGGGTLSLHEFRDGASTILGRPMPRALLAPYFSPEHFNDGALRAEGVVTWTVFEKICIENFAMYGATTPTPTRAHDNTKDTNT